MVQQVEIAFVPEVLEGSQVCQHHWLIQAADGPVSGGVCRVCGETREFKNYVESATWGDTRLISHPAPVSPELILAAAGPDSWEDE